MEWMLAHWGDLLVLGALALTVAGVIGNLRKKKGGCSGCNGCSSCSACAGCRYKVENKKASPL